MKPADKTNVESIESANSVQSESGDQKTFRQATLGQSERNVEDLADLNNKNKHRFVIADFASECFPADLLLDSLDNFDSLTPKDVEEYAKNIDSDSPKFDPTAKVLAKIQSFDVADYKEFFEKHKERTKSSSSNKTNKQRITELTDEVNRLASAQQSHRNLLSEINQKLNKLLE
jgi:hypothetical protein